MMKKLLLIAIILVITGCVSAQNARFYHPTLGIVDGNNQQLKVDSIDCFTRNSATQLDETDVMLGTVGTVAKEVDEESVGNVALTALLAKKGYEIANGQSSCMTQRGWLRLENAEM